MRSRGVELAIFKEGKASEIPCALENLAGEKGFITSLASFRRRVARWLFLPLLFATPGMGAAQESSCPAAAAHFLEAAEGAEDAVARQSLLEQAIDLCPEDPEPYLLLGRLYQSLNFKSRARRAYADALGRVPHLREILQEMSELNPGSQDDSIFQALLSSEAGKRVALAPEESAEELLVKEPTDHKARLTLAEELTSRGQDMLNQNLPGLPLIQRAVELAPDYRRARELLVEHHRTLGDYHYNGELYKKALAQYLKGLAYGPEDPLLHLQAAESYSRLEGREEDALGHYREADQVFAARVEEMNEEERRSLRERIKRGLTRLDDTQPEYRQAQGARVHTEGRQLLARGDYEAASRILKDAIGWTPGNALIHFDLATALKQLPPHRGAALSQFQRALSLFETHPPAQVASQVDRFKARTQLEIDHLSGEAGSLTYILRQLAVGAQARAIEIGLFVFSFGGIAAYLLRAGRRFNGGGADAPDAEG
jgi:tetratricopeptide (TPR) repeat protein